MSYALGSIKDASSFCKRGPHSTPFNGGEDEWEDEFAKERTDIVDIVNNNQEIDKGGQRIPLQLGRVG